MQRSLFFVALTITLTATPAAGQAPSEVMTGPDSILCLSRDNVSLANQPAVSRSQTVLRGMGCLRAEAGIRSRLLDADKGSGPVRVRFYPAGISSGLMLWAFPSSFVAADRTTLVSKTRL